MQWRSWNAYGARIYQQTFIDAIDAITVRTSNQLAPTRVLLSPRPPPYTFTYFHTVVWCCSDCNYSFLECFGICNNYNKLLPSFVWHRPWHFFSLIPTLALI